MGVGSRYPSLPPGVSHVIILPTILLVQPAIQRSPQPPPWLTRRPLHCRGGGAARHGARLLLPFYITTATSGAMLESWHCVDRAAIELARSTRTMLLAEPALPRRSAAWLLGLRAGGGWCNHADLFGGVLLAEATLKSSCIAPSSNAEPTRAPCLVHSPRTTSLSVAAAAWSRARLFEFGVVMAASTSPAAVVVSFARPQLCRSRARHASSCRHTCQGQLVRCSLHQHILASLHASSNCRLTLAHLYCS